MLVYKVKKEKLTDHTSCCRRVRTTSRRPGMNAGVAPAIVELGEEDEGMQRVEEISRKRSSITSSGGRARLERSPASGGAINNDGLTHGHVLDVGED